MRCGLDVLQALALEGDADQQRAPHQPWSARQRGEQAVIVARAVAEAIADVVEADQRHQHEIEADDIDEWCSDRFADAHPVARQGAAEITPENHGVSGEITDARQVEVAAAPQRQRP